MGLKDLNLFATDYMLETMFLVYYLLFNYYLLNLYIDVKKNKCSFILNSENNNNTDTIINNNYTDIQSAENCKGFSETIRQLSNKKDNILFFQ
jgi:hypothetical protein